MKLLFDENISYRIVRKLEDVFPNSEQVKRLGLLQKRDTIIWSYALQHNFAIVTHDEDYLELSLLQGYPPKDVWLRTGNITTDDLADLLRKNAIQIQSFIEKSDLEDTGCFELYR